MSSSSGDEETSVESMSPISMQRKSRQEPAFAPSGTCTSAAGHYPVGSRAGARLDRPFVHKEEWSQYKPLMRRLYMDENKTLAEVIDHMKRHHGFTAS